MTTTPSHFLILNGSARSDGDTAAVVTRLVQALPPSAATVIDLCALELRPFSYEGAGKDNDSFQILVAQILAHSHLIIATPVYWYAMSGLTKTVFDRLTDLLQSAELRALGRALAGRTLSLMVNGTDPGLPPGFAEPFQRTAAYFDMTWQGEIYLKAEPPGPPGARELEKLDAFAGRLLSS